MEAEEAKETGPKMRVAFDREKDMQGNVRFLRVLERIPIEHIYLICS